MTPKILLDECRARGVAVRLVGGVIKLRGRSDAVRAATVRLRPHKAELFKYLMTNIPQEKPDVCGDFTPYVCPASVSTALTQELHSLIVQFGEAYRITDTALTRIKSAAMTQPAGSVAECVEYFKQAIK